MRLSKKQRLFTRLQAEFVTWAFENGYELTDGDAYRNPRVFGEVGIKRGYGRSKSNHKLRLARDYNLFIDNTFQETTEAHRPLGEKWESMHKLAVWGGRWSDGNHYSFKHEGRR